jgi:DNA-binding response OmpR family regulator
MQAKLLLLEDDDQLREIVCEYLEDNGYKVVCAEDANEAMDRLYEESFDLLLFDVKVPFMSGFDLLSKIRTDGNETPTIFLTSLNSMDDLSKAYDSGCDDYLKKPFELKELLLRVKTLTKRAFFHKKQDDKVLLNGDVFFDIKSNKVHKDGQIISLSKKESLILKLLMKHKGVIVTPEQIFQNAWDYEDEPSELSLRTYIKNIRKVIGKDLIENARGQGYILVTG